MKGIMSLFLLHRRLPPYIGVIQLFLFPEATSSPRVHCQICPTCNINTSKICSNNRNKNGVRKVIDDYLNLFSSLASPWPLKEEEN